MQHGAGFRPAPVRENLRPVQRNSAANAARQRYGNVSVAVPAQEETLAGAHGDWLKALTPTKRSATFKRTANLTRSVIRGGRFIY